MCLERKWRGKETLLLWDMFTTAQLPTPFPSRLRVHCGFLNPSLLVTEAFGISIFITCLHNSKCLGGTLDMKRAEKIEECSYHFFPTLLPFYLNWFSKLPVTSIMQLYQPYRLNDSSSFSGFQHHCNAWKKWILMRYHNEGTLMAAYIEKVENHDKQRAQKFSMKEVNQEFYFHSWENTLVGQQMTMVKKMKISTSVCMWLSFEIILMKALHRQIFI